MEWLIPSNTQMVRGIPIGALNDLTKKVNLLFSIIGSGIASAVLPPTGTIDDSNKAFVFSQLPSVLIINGGMYQQTGGSITWTWNSGTLTATLSSAVGTGGSIFGLK